MISDVKLWWLLMSVVSILNIVLLIGSVILYRRRRHSIDKDIRFRRKVILLCSVVYTLVCAYRSFLPRIDLERVCLFDHWVTNVFVGRSVSTLAELLFVVQCAILLHEVGRALHNRFSMRVAWSLVPLIVVAECFSWYGMLSTNNLGSVIEESLWTLCAALLLSSFIALWPHIETHHRKYAASMIVFGAGFILFMVNIDVPMYWQRWQQDVAAGVQYHNMLDGLVDSVRNCTVSDDIAVWAPEMSWMTLYFTVAVWVSISMAHAPDYRLYRVR